MTFLRRDADSSTSITRRRGESPASNANLPRSWPQTLLTVPIVMAGACWTMTRSPFLKKASVTRSRISSEALLVKVVAMIRSGLTPDSTAWEMISVSLYVLPEPAPALMKVRFTVDRSTHRCPGKGRKGQMPLPAAARLQVLRPARPIPRLPRRLLRCGLHRAGADATRSWS
jgi:hypothetical protein